RRDAALYRAAEVGLRRWRACHRRHVSLSREPRGGSRGKPHADVVVRYDRDATLLEVLVSASVVAMIVRVDHVLDGQRRDRLDGGLDLVRQRRELAIDHEDALVTDGDGDISALPRQHVSPV